MLCNSKLLLNCTGDYYKLIIKGVMGYDEEEDFKWKKMRILDDLDKKIATKDYPFRMKEKRTEMWNQVLAECLRKQGDKNNWPYSTLKIEPHSWETQLMTTHVVLFITSEVLHLRHAFPDVRCEHFVTINIYLPLNPMVCMGCALVPLPVPPIWVFFLGGCLLFFHCFWTYFLLDFLSAYLCVNSFMLALFLLVAYCNPLQCLQSDALITILTLCIYAIYFGP